MNIFLTSVSTSVFVLAAPEGGGHQVLGSRCRVRPPLRLPGRTVWTEGRRRTLRLRLFTNDGQRRRFLKLLWCLPSGPLRGREGRKRNEWDDGWINGWARENESGPFEYPLIGKKKKKKKVVGCRPECWIFNVWLDGYTEGWKYWGLKASFEWGTLQEDGVKGKRKTGSVFLTLHEAKPNRQGSRYAEIMCNCAKTYVRIHFFFFYSWGRKLSFGCQKATEKHSRPWGLPVRWELPKKFAHSAAFMSN